MILEGNDAGWWEGHRAAAQRYADSRPEREANHERRQAEDLRVLDSPEQLKARAARLLESGQVPVEGLLQEVASHGRDLPKALERIIGAANDLQAVSFLTRGVRAAASVARICQLGSGREIPLGTGFLVSPQLLMTNNHVLPTPQEALTAGVEFAYEIGMDGIQVAPAAFGLDPDAFFVTDRRLDFTLVAVRPGADGVRPGERFGCSQLIRAQGKIVVGEALNIIGHPMGRRKEISIRNNSLEHQLDEFLQYRTDTEPGNSGSPVFNDQWEVVALHHRGVYRMDDEGQPLRKDGERWQEGDGEDAMDWIANEGTRVSVILDHLRSLALDERRRALLDELGNQAQVVQAPPTGTSAVIAPAGPTATEAAPPVRRGLDGRTGAFGGRAQLLFLHGRRQERKDPESLRREWTAGLNRGLTMSGLAGIDPRDAWFPYYGDRFIAVVNDRERLVPAVSAEELLADPAESLAPPEPSTRAVYEALIGEAAAATGMPTTGDGLARGAGPDLARGAGPDLARGAGPDLARGAGPDLARGAGPDLARGAGPDLARGAGPDLARGLDQEGIFNSVTGRLGTQLGWLANNTGLDSLTIALLFRDVAAYLDRDQVRRAVLDAVRETVPARGPLVLVSHSLGTVVAMDLLTELSAELNVVMLVTAGSPLGQDTVYTRLLSRGPHRPQRVGHWLNVWSAADAVAIGCPLRDDWKGQLEDAPVNNPREQAHSIAEYLAHPAVARRIGTALGLA